MLLEGLAGEVEREVVRVDDAAKEGEVLGHEGVELLRDEDTPDVELDALLADRRVKLRVRGSLGQVDDGLEGAIVALGGEVGVGQRRVVLAGDGLEEVVILLVLNVLLPP